MSLRPYQRQAEAERLDDEGLLLLRPHVPHLLMYGPKKLSYESLNSNARMSLISNARMSRTCPVCGSGGGGGGGGEEREREGKRRGREGGGSEGARERGREREK